MPYCFWDDPYGWMRVQNNFFGWFILTILSKRYIVELAQIRDIQLQSYQNTWQIGAINAWSLAVCYPWECLQVKEVSDIPGHTYIPIWSLPD